ncbi:hypothetical protein [Streptomyces californicus]|uniref:hypothetical protein n=1 Tax=Streptomyces TaxID=1883 RepID=UPI0036E2703C
MSLGKNDDVPPPPAKGEYHIKFANRQAAVGWRQLMQQIPANTNTAWYLMRKTPSPAVETDRHHRLKFALAEGVRDGETFPQWQIEVSGGGRIWYLHDENRQTCWVTQAGTGHPRQTDR